MNYSCHLGYTHLGERETSANKSGVRHPCHFVRQERPRGCRTKAAQLAIAGTERDPLNSKIKETGTYAGAWENNKRNGFGKEENLKKGERYDGQWCNDKRHGHGTLWVRNEEGDYVKLYEGEWSFNQRHGYGTFYFEDGSKYEGEFVKGKQHGKGTLYYATGDKYEGEVRWIHSANKLCIGNEYTKANVNVCMYDAV